MKLKWMVVGIVVLAFVGIYYYAPNMLQGIGSNEVRITPKYVNVPSYLPEDLTVQTFVDGVEAQGSFSVDVGSTHSLTFRVLYSSGLIYGETTRMFTAPSESGNYDMVIDGTARTMELVKT